ncbi:hypothetical protein OHA40_06445 [Nocardia sp. NBC_00508]|uniref:hypothetical protein n=1 Tax=Nocardia sp. NBC_00508 TaxID=2975992 RepID=UPI002E80C647|nr:hypothetical protein [Nocardia sp. NBC_00508]WUD67765.1 hypothetical protein OHA40_06445 [Nocardia sp. NBC_00508]
MACSGFEAFTPVGDPERTLGLYTVEPGPPSANALRLLAGRSADATSEPGKHPGR